MTIRTLENTSIEELLTVFNKSFENYFVPFKLTAEQLSFKIKVDNVQLDLSTGIFDRDKLVGFILHGLDASKKCVYNCGTGVIDSHRGSGFTKKLFDFIIPILIERGITHSRLEVVKQNVVAKSIYEKVGFVVLRTVNCMSTNTAITPKKSIEVHQITGNEMNPCIMDDEMTPTWQCSVQSIGFQKENLVQYVVKDNDEIIGNLVLSSSSNRILRLNVKKDKRRQGIGNALLSHTSKKNANLSVINLDSTDDQVIGFFKSQGFDVYLQQYEMLNEFN